MRESGATWLRSRLERLTYGFLLVPGAIALVFVVSAALLIRVDLTAPDLGGTFAGGPEAARQILSTIAGSLITVAGLAFSVTIVTLQLVSSQYSPRALRNFLRDRLNQVVAGVFVGTFAYCLLVLSMVRSAAGEEGPFVPALSVNVGIVFAMLALALLLIFIHHMSRSIQVSRISNEIGHEGLKAVERLYPEAYGRPVEEHADRIVESWTQVGAPALIRPTRPGFVESVGIDELVEAVGARDGGGDEVRIHLRVAPGDFVTEQTVLATVWPGEIADRKSAEVRRAVVIADQRNIEQDASYAIRQLVDIALRAISPAVNDPTTAIDCVGYTQAIIERIAGRRFPEPVRTFEDARLTLVARRREFDDFIEEGFAELGRYASSDPRVVLRLLRALEATARAAVEADARERLPVVMETADGIGERAMADAATEHDRRSISEAVERVRRTQAPHGSGTSDEASQPPGGRESSPGG